MNNPINVAMIGLGFGAEFIPIYQALESTNVYALCRRNEDELNKSAAQFGVEKRYTGQIQSSVFSVFRRRGLWSRGGIINHGRVTYSPGPHTRSTLVQKGYPPDLTIPELIVTLLIQKQLQNVCM